MNFWEHIIGTHTLSWVDRRFHLNELSSVIPNFDIATVQKIYLLGYAEASAGILAKISQCVQRKNAWELQQIFGALPYAEDGLGLTVMGNMFNVYFLLDKAGQCFVCVVSAATHRAELWSKASGFPYYLLFGKRLIYPPLALLPQD